VPARVGTGGRHTGDLLLFPARLRLTDVPAERLPAVMDALYAEGLADRSALARALQTATGPSATVADLVPALRYLFVCAHARRDDRCGACLGGLLPALRAATAAPGARPRGLSVWATSHIGGHAHAGNVMYVHAQLVLGCGMADMRGVPFFVTLRTQRLWRRRLVRPAAAGGRTRPAHRAGRRHAAPAALAWAVRQLTNKVVLKGATNFGSPINHHAFPIAGWGCHWKSS